MSVDVGGAEPLRDHEDLQVVQQLRDLLGRFCVALVLGGHPDFGGLLDDFLTNGVYAGVEFTNGSRTFWAGPGLLSELGEEFVESFHVYRLLVLVSG